MKQLIKGSMPIGGPGIIRKIYFLAILFFLLSLLTGLALAQDGFDLSWWSIDGGGQASSTGDDYILAGTIGQSDAGDLSGGVYTLSGGFWTGSSTGFSQHILYLPLIIH